jgi:hypothetical protein
VVILLLFNNQPHGAGSRYERVQGVVAALKQAFGFIEVLDRSMPALFFHADKLRTAAFADLAVDDEVDFVIATVRARRREWRPRQQTRTP